MEVDNLFSCLAAFKKDSKLNAWHFALLSAILFLEYRQGQAIIIKVSPSKLMSLCHIKTLPSYHNYFKDCKAWLHTLYPFLSFPDTKAKLNYN